jgi:HAD superfamily hydrolase (TIGR01509 family)
MELTQILQEYNINKKKALLFDVDGTLAQTMESHNKAYELAFSLNEVPFNMEEHKKWAPYGGKILMEETVVKKGYAEKVDDIIRDKQRLLQFTLEKYMEPNETLVQLIKDKHETHLIGVVSNGRKRSIQQILDALGLTFYVHHLTTSDILGQAKPSPEAYNYTMLMLQVKPEEVIVFEDNQIGFQAAEAAGIEAIVEVKYEDE